MLGNSSRKYVSIYTSSANTVARAVEVLNSKIDSVFDLLFKCRSASDKNAEASQSCCRIYSRQYWWLVAGSEIMAARHLHKNYKSEI